MVVFNLPTLLAITAFTSGLAGCLLLLSWLQHRRIFALALWGSAFVIAAIATVLIVIARGNVPDFWSIVIGNAILAAAYGLIWSGARSFEGKRLSIALTLAGALIWLVYARPEARATVMAAIAIAYALLTVLELWRGRGDGIWRWPIMLLLLGHAAAIPVRIPLAGEWTNPNPFDVDLRTFAIFEAVFVCTCAAYLFGGLVKDRVAARYQRASLIDPLTGVANAATHASGAAPPVVALSSQPRNQSVAELRGAKLGTTSLKEGTCHLMEKMMAAHGMYQPVDFQFVVAGAHPQRWEALKAGTLDAAIQLVPFNYIAEESGFPNLGDVDEYVPDFLFCAVCTRMNWANENRDHLIGLLRALRRGAEALYDDPSGAAAVVLDKMNINPDHALSACRDFVSKKIIPKDLSINPQAFAATLEAMRRGELIKDQPQSEMQACIDMRFLSASEP
jgi:NMT1/THI5 like